MSDRRKRSRVETHVGAEFVQGNNLPIPIITRNVSLKGMLAEPAEGITAKENGVVQITLTPEIVIAVESRIIRSDATGIAIEFLLMSPESFLHLRNLVRYNALDADAIDEEIRSHI